MSSTGSSNRPADASGPGSWRLAIGWAIVIINTSVACLWAFWGAIENFHEGWYWPSLARNLLGALAYHTPMLIWTALGLLAVRWARVGAVTYITVGLGLAAWLYVLQTGGLQVAFLLGGFGAIFGALWWIGRPHPKRWAYRVTWGLPVAVAVISGAEGAYRVATRFDDGDRGARLVEGNGVTLTWAPQGPGWPTHGVAFNEAVERCRHLTDDGLALADEPLDLWRLPTVSEIVRSLTRHGDNAGGTWDADRGRASYETRPDKEAPLWDPYSPIIYWWAADEVDPDHAYRVVHNGLVLLKPRDLGMGSQGFRAVRAGQ